MEMMPRKVTAVRKVYWSVSNVNQEFINILGDEDFDSPTFKITVGSKEFELCLCVESSEWNLYRIEFSLQRIFNLDFFINFEGFFKISLMDDAGNIIFEGARKELKFGEAKSVTLGRQRLFELLGGNTTVNILCEIQISVSRKYLMKVLKPIKPDENNVRIFKESLFCDYEVEASNGKVFKTHRSFLAVHSPVFEAMLKHDTKESRNGRVKLEDISSKTVKELLRFIYTGDIKDEKKVARDVLTAADKYQIEGLKTRCCEILVGEVTKENAVEMVLIADHVKNDELFQRSLDFIADDFKRISNYADWNKIGTRLMTRMMAELCGTFDEIHL